MAPRPSDLAILKAALDGDLGLLKKMARQMDLREAKDDEEGQNALHFAAAMGHLEVCRFLVEESGLDVNSSTTDGTTPVAHAASEGKVGVLRYLLDHGGDPAMRDDAGTMPLHYADLGHYEAVRLLLSRGVDVDALTCRGASPLQLAAEEGHDQTVKVLLEHGADPNRVSHNMFSPLISACYVGSLKCTKLLVEAGADVNLTNPYGPNALMMAADFGLADIVRFLLEAGADPNISDEDGKIAIMYAAKNRLREIVQILLPRTKPITPLPNWSVDGIIDTMKYISFKSMVKELASAKSRGNEAFEKGDYLAATNLYVMALLKDPLDATLFSNRSLCWLRLGDGKLALLDAQQCKAMHPWWPKAWYREGAALSLLKDYKGAANAFLEALKLDPGSDEIKTALREATEALSAACSEQQNPGAASSSYYDISD